MDLNINFNIPPIKLPCGELLGLRLDTRAMLRSAGVKTLTVENCFYCHKAHEIPLPTIPTVAINMSALVATPSLVTVPPSSRRN